MTEDQRIFIKENEATFELVLQHGQEFQEGHDITKKVLAIGESITGKPYGQCGCTIPEVYKTVWDAYNEPAITKKSKTNE